MEHQKDLPENYAESAWILEALKASPAPTAVYFGENIIIKFANQGMLDLWEKDASVIGKPLMEAIPELEGQPFFGLLQNVWQSGQPYAVSDAPAKLVKDGIETLDYFDYEYRPLLDNTGVVWCILNTALNVTPRREFLRQLQEKEERERFLNEEMAAALEELTLTNEELSCSLLELAQSKEYIRTIIEQAPVGIAMLKGPEHIIEIANPEILKIWGREEEDLIGLPHSVARPELRDQPVIPWLNKVYRTGMAKTNKEFPVQLRDGDGLRLAIVNSIYQPILSPDGEVSGVLIILEEITKQVLERRNNENDQQMLRLAIDAGQLATFYYQPSTNLFSGNNLLKEWFGLSEADNLDLSIAISAIVPEDRSRVADAIEKALSIDSDGEYSIEYQIKSGVKDKPRLIQANGRVFYDQQGTPLSLNGTLRDITIQKKEEQRKDDFMGMVSHELKTPITSLKIYLQILQQMAAKNGELTYQSTLEKSLKQVDNMTNMINSFLNVSRLDSGLMHLEKMDFDLEILLAEMEDEMLSTVTTHYFRFRSAGSLRLTADREKILQVLYNLIGNAVKYSPSGSTVTVSYGWINDLCWIEVKDEGRGISAEDQIRIFDRYYRVQHSDSTSIAGFGIGLYLCKEIVELHGGIISVKSEEGTTFRFELPVNGKR